MTIRKKNKFTIETTGLVGVMPLIENEFRKAEQTAVIQSAVKVAEKEGFGNGWTVDVRYRREGEKVVYYDVIVRKLPDSEPVIEKWEVSANEAD